MAGSELQRHRPVRPAGQTQAQKGRWTSERAASLTCICSSQLHLGLVVLPFEVCGFFTSIMLFLHLSKLLYCSSSVFDAIINAGHLLLVIEGP